MEMLYIGLCVLNNEGDKVKPMRKGKSSQVGRTGQAQVQRAHGTKCRVSPALGEVVLMTRSR